MYAKFAAARLLKQRYQVPQLAPYSLPFPPLPVGFETVLYMSVADLPAPLLGGTPSRLRVAVRAGVNQTRPARMAAGHDHRRRHCRE